MRSRGATVRLVRVPIDAGGYDPQETYFGLGEPLWWAATDDGSLDTTFRAVDEETASAHARTFLPTTSLIVDGVVGRSGRAAALAADPAFASDLATMLREAQLDEEDNARNKRREARTVNTVEELTDDVYEASLAVRRRFAEENAADLAAPQALVPNAEGFS